MQTYTASPWWLWDRYLHMKRTWGKISPLMLCYEGKKAFKSFQNHHVLFWFSHRGATSVINIVSSPLFFALLVEMNKNYGRSEEDTPRWTEPHIPKPMLKMIFQLLSGNTGYDQSPPHWIIKLPVLLSFVFVSFWCWLSCLYSHPGSGCHLLMSRSLW